MKRFVEGEDRRQATLLPDCLEDYVTEDNPVRIVEVFIDELDLAALGFAGIVPEMTDRPSYHPATLLKIYIYGYLNRIQSSRRLERETQRNLEMMWLAGRLMPDIKTIADFRRDNGPAIRAACAQFVVLCRQLNLFSRAVVAIDGSKFKAVNARQQRLLDNDAGYVEPADMLAELLDDNKQLAAFMRQTHDLADDHDDVATESLLEEFIDQTEERIWFLFEASRGMQASGH